MQKAEGSRFAMGTSARCTSGGRGDRSGIQVEAHDVVQEPGGLGLGKAQIGGPELNRLAARSQTG
jgi:hypothetical protein